MNFLLYIAFCDKVFDLITLHEMLGCYLLKGYLAYFTDKSFISFERPRISLMPYFVSLSYFIDYFLTFLGAVFNFYNFATY